MNFHFFLHFPLLMKKMDSAVIPLKNSFQRLGKKCEQVRIGGQHGLLAVSHSTFTHGDT